MKKAIFLAAGLLMAVTAIAPASAEFVWQDGDYTRSSDGSWSRDMGGGMYHNSNGITSRRSGDTMYHSDGTTSRRVGNMIYNSDGSTCSVVGNMMTCN